MHYESLSHLLLIRMLAILQMESGRSGELLGTFV
jgi:hypothetical protein